MILMSETASRWTSTYLWFCCCWSSCCSSHPRFESFCSRCSCSYSSVINSGSNSSNGTITSSDIICFNCCVCGEEKSKIILINLFRCLVLRTEWFCKKKNLVRSCRRWRLSKFFYEWFYGVRMCWRPWTISAKNRQYWEAEMKIKMMSKKRRLQTTWTVFTSSRVRLTSLYLDSATLWISGRC